MKNAKRGISLKKLGIVATVAIVIFGGIIIPRIIEGNETTTLGVAIVSWNVIGIDANKPGTDGPNCSVVQVRVWNNGSYNATNVIVSFNWNSTENSTYIYLHENELATKNVGTIEAGKCKDVFFVVNITRSSASKDKTRAFTINVTADNANPANASQRLMVKGLGDQGQDSCKFVYISNSSPEICTNFEVYVWSNVTAEAIESSFPIAYDPAIVELVNITIYKKGAGNVTEGIIYEVYTNNETFARGSHFVIYTFHAIGSGNATLNPIIIDKRPGNKYDYNQDYGTANIPPIIPKYPNITASKTVWNGFSWGENITVNGGDIVTFNITVASTGTEELSFINITDILPVSFSYVNGSAKKNNTSISDPVQWGNNISWNLTGPFSNSTWFYITFNATAVGSGNLTNIAKVTAEGNKSHILVYKEDYAYVRVINPSLQLTKIANKSTANVGETITYTYYVNNTGDTTISS
ncbi:MAG: hypothetical protein QW519_03065, partial [Candidatus Thermoplasmatota archaeon]